MKWSSWKMTLVTSDAYWFIGPLILVSNRRYLSRMVGHPTPWAVLCLSCGMSDLRSLMHAQEKPVLLDKTPVLRGLDQDEDDLFEAPEAEWVLVLKLLWHRDQLGNWQSEGSCAKVNGILPLNKIAPDFEYRFYLYLSLFLRYVRHVDKLINRYTVIRDNRPTGNKDK
ncbi:hypothetical protein MG293_005241 [Ovis ammon polii]|uniref:Uncharacterized protein n=1 Tax=Ovis ammon polii TaxID=230172 RepID=A0AAD4YBI8_OVIAM|nr:hypothetical protein MG293_005241 [Ovis ammon polii]